MSILTIVLFILLLTLIISIHEFGHFIACRIFNVYVDEFSIGMGPSLFHKQFKETLFSIRALPLGGYCSMADNNKPNENGEDKYSFLPKERTMEGIARWKRLIIQISGIIMNVILAILIVAGVYLSIGQVNESPKPIINQVMENSAAYNAGLKTNDLVTNISYENGYSLSPNSFAEMSDFLSLYEEGEILLSVSRNNENIELKIIPDYDSENDRYVLGITSYEYQVVNVNILNCFKYAYLYLLTMTKIIFTSLIGLFKGVGLENVSGPIGIYTATEQAISFGVTSYLLLIAVLSLNVGIFNLIPIPALDGGRMVITFVEMIVRKPIPKKVESLIMSFSVALFLFIFVYATFQDITRIFNK